MNKETFGYRIIRSLFSVFSGIVTLIGLFISFIAWKYKASANISFFLFVLIDSFLLVFIVVFVKLSIDLFKEKSSNLVKVISYIEPYSPYKNCEAILLTTNSDSFAINGIVSIFLEKNGCEIYLAMGQIINIQQNEKVQILIPKNQNTDFDWNKLKTNEKDMIEKIIVKPIINIQLLGGNFNG